MKNEIKKNYRTYRSQKLEFRGKPTAEKILESLPYSCGISGANNSVNISFLEGFSKFKK